MTHNPWTPKQVELVRRLAGRERPFVIVERANLIGPSHTLASLYAWASKHRFSIRPDRRDRRMTDRRRFEWSAREDVALRKLVGLMGDGDIAEELNRRFYTERTGNSVRKRAFVLSLSLKRHDVLRMDAMVRTFPIHNVRIVAMVDDGQLRAERRGNGHRGSAWLFLPADIEAWIRAHPHLFDWRRVALGRWRDFVRAVTLRDPYVTVREAAALLGLKRGAVLKRIKHGHIAGVRAGGTPLKPIYRIPLRALDQIERLAWKGRAA